MVPMEGPSASILLPVTSSLLAASPPVRSLLPGPSPSLTASNAGDTSYLPSALPEPVPETEIAISPTSTRLELLAPFDPHFSPAAFADPSVPLEFKDLRCLLRIRGKCTTDEISAAGAWLKYKGHLSNIRFVASS